MPSPTRRAPCPPAAEFVKRAKASPSNISVTANDKTVNIWEWTSTRYREAPPMAGSRCCGPPRSGQLATIGKPDPFPSRTIKGGSHLCTIQYCFRYRPAARQPQTIDTSAGHIGFRCVSRDRT